MVGPSMTTQLGSPLTTTPASSSQHPPREAAQLRDARVLVVDDDPDMRDFLKEELEDEGYAVELASGGRSAVERVKQGGIDLVVSDVRMPDLDGLDLLRELQASAFQPHVITITAFGSID